MTISVWSSVWICVLLFCGVNSLSFPAKIGFYDKVVSTKQQLMNNIYQNSKDKNNLKMETSMLWSDQLDKEPNSNSVPTIVRTNNFTVLFNNMDLWVIKDEKFEYRVSLLSKYNYDVQLVKGFEWQTRLFLLVCFQNNVCSLYSATPDFSITYHQAISSDKQLKVPTDAQFFVQAGKLFLSVLFHGSLMSQLRIYQWHNLYMDPELIPDIFSTATSITLFGYKEDIVLVLGCPADDRGSVKFHSQVWCRKKSGEMFKVQYLPTENPISITHFMERGENFILILEEDSDASIYWWEGSDFVRWLSVDGMVKHSKVEVSTNLKYTTFLIFTQNNVLRIYLMTSAKLDNIYEKEFFSGDKTEVISILSATVFEENGITYMLLLTKSQYQLRISLHNINVEILDTLAYEPSNEGHRSDTAQEALNTVYDEVNSLKNVMDYLDASLLSVLLTNKDITINDGVVRVSEEIHIEGGDIWELMHTQVDIAGSIHNLHNYITPISQDINLCWEKLETTSLYPNRHLLFHGNVMLKEAKMNSVFADVVNSNRFEPGSFLLLNNSMQKLKSVKAKKVKVNWLAISKIGDKEINDCLFTDPRVNVPVSVAGLESRNLRISENTTINNISVQDLANKMVTTETEGDRRDTISQISAGEDSTKQETLQLQDNTVIQNLNVEFIDGVSINGVLTSVFVNKIQNVIHGNLHFKAGVRTSQIAAGKFNILGKQNLEFPKPQVYSHAQMRIPANKPCTPQELHYLPYWVPLKSFTYGGRRNKRDVYGDAERNIRKVKVKIFGDLKVAKLLFRNSSLVVNNQSVPTLDLAKTFWTTTSPQEIHGSVHFAQGISIGRSLEDTIINGKNLSHYATLRSNFNSLTFEDIHVDGNISTGENYSLRIQENELQGSEFKVLNVKHLKVGKINGGNTKNILQAKDLLGRGIKIMTENLHVGGDLEVNLINDINVKQKFESAVMADGDIELNEVEFQSISGDNLIVENLNNHSTDSLIKFSSSKNSSVFISGDIQVSQLSEVTSINNHPANFSKVVNKRKGAKEVYGKKIFNAQVVISKELKVTNINNVDFESWLSNLLRVSGDQNVTGFYTIKNAEMRSQFNVNAINGISLSSFVYTNQPIVNLVSNIKFKSIAVDGNVTSASLHESCQLPQVVEDDIVFEQSSEWSSVVISGDSNWPRTKDSPLQHLFESAVTSYGNQTITGDVTFLHLSVPNVQVRSLNEKNITFIFQDSLSRRKKNQVITGKKMFLESFKCKNIYAKGDANVKSINNVNINSFDEKLVRRFGDEREIIYGHKTFLNGFKAFKLECSEGINGVKAENIVGRDFVGVAPPFSVQSLKVLGPLEVETIDDVHIEHFIEDCIKLDSADRQLIKGQLHIRGNVSLQGEVTAFRINNISINDAVFVNNKNTPARISGCKRFLSNLEIESEPNIEILNVRNLSQTYKDNVKTDQNVTINGSVTIESQVSVDTIHAHEYFVGSKQLTYLNKTFLP